MYVSRVNSTNSLAAELIRKGKLRYGEPLYTYCQTEGRGQRGNHWESEPGKNLLLSLVLAPDKLMAEEQFILSETVAVALKNVLAKYTHHVHIKWPNDIYVGDKKIAGILIENTLNGAYIKHSIIGIGVNINQKRFSDRVPNPISLKLLTGKSHRKRSILNEFLTEFGQLIQLIHQKNVIYSRYTESLLGFNQYREYRLPNGTLFEAKAVAIQPDGGMTLEDTHKHRQTYHFKEVAFIF